MTSPTPQTAPVNVAGLTSGVTAVVAGDAHTCALTSSGQVSCWGANQYGQLGAGTTDSNQPRVVINSGATAIAAGDFHSCAVIVPSRGVTQVKCWGRNFDGQIGDNTTTDRPTPVQVYSNATSAITAGSMHTCIVANGAVKCWGANSAGQLGDNSTFNKPVPTQVSGLVSGAVDVVAGAEHSCAVVGANRSLRCWGLNSFSQVSNADKSRELIPVTLADNNVVAVAMGRMHTCAVANGGITCWGLNEHGQLGDGKSGLSPQTVLVTWPPPDPPTLVRLQPIDQGMRVYFTPPASDNGTDIDSYTATCTPTGGTPVSVIGTTSPLTVTGLVNGVSYLCTVSATSTAGTSSASGALTRVVRKGDLTPILMLLLD
ncbi:MAG: fibronectin type III domain-containing protein [Comamonadaceae bacterium]|nr:fibronectin type III domain-containing protein [Comamonadaceae bacterium]